MLVSARLEAPVLSLLTYGASSNARASRSVNATTALVVSVVSVWSVEPVWSVEAVEAAEAAHRRSTELTTNVISVTISVDTGAW